MNVTAVIYHDTRRKKNYETYPPGHPLHATQDSSKQEKKDSIYPVKLRITYKREQRYYPYSAKYDLTKKDFNRVFGDKPRGDFKVIQDVLTAERKKADNIITGLGDRFSFTLFDKRFKRPEGSSKNIFWLLDTLAKKLKANDQISTAVLTECTLSSLKKFHPKKELSLDEVDVQFLERYEKWMVLEGNSKATIGMYIRRIRVIFNDAKSDGIIPPDLYPFGSGRNNFKIPVGRNFKKALSIADVGLIFNYKPANEGQAKAQAYWLLTYLCNGMNMKDVALLKFENIDGKMIRFERAKTIRANKGNPVTISFPYTPTIKQIVKRWGNKSVWKGNYIFPILENKATADDIYKGVANVVKTTNKHMRAISKKLGIEGKITTYVARHSFATIVRNSGKSVEFISEALGHNSTKTTQGYLAGFEDAAKEEVAEVLTNFPKTGTE